MNSLKRHIIPLCKGLLVFALLLRVALISWPYESGDYVAFLSMWIEYIKENGFLRALATIPSNYNYPYLYILTAIAALPGSNLMQIKIVSALFDFVAAYFGGRLLQLAKGGQKRMFWIGAAGVALLPTVVINSSVWAQCDSIYGSFCLAAIYYFCRKKQTLAMIFWGLAFAFKLQAIFLAPFFILMLLQRRLKWSRLLWVPVVCFIAIVPALIFGTSLYDALAVYWRQTATSYKTAFGVFPSVWQLWNVNYSPIVAKSFACLTVVATIAWALWAKSRYVPGENPAKVVLTAITTIAVLLFLLVFMHDRYLYVVDLLSVIIFVRYQRLRWTAVTLIVISLILYLKYLLSPPGWFDTHHSAFLILRFSLLAAYFSALISLVRVWARETEKFVTLPRNNQSQ